MKRSSGRTGAPEQVSVWLKKNTDTSVSHEWVYQYIYLDKRSGGDLHQHLRCQKKRRKRIGAYDRRGQNPHQVSIEERPEIVDQRKRIGDWEADTIIGAGKQGAIVTLVARKSRFTPLKKVTRCTAAVEEAILDLLRPYPMSVHKNIFDNGKEFPNH